MVASFARRHGYVVAVFVVLVATAAFIPLRATVTFTHLAWVYLCLVGAIAWMAGTGPALLTATLSFLAGNFFLTPPFGTFVVGHPRDLILLAAFFLAAVAVGALTSQARQRHIEALANERRATTLARLAAEMAEGADVDAIVRSAVVSLTRLASVESVTVWLRGDQGGLRALGPGARFVADKDHELALEAFRSVKSLGLPESARRSDSLGAGWPAQDAKATDSCCGVFIPLVSSSEVGGVLQLLLGSAVLGSDDAAIAVSVSHLLAVFLSERRARENASHLYVSQEASRVKSAIVSAVSHELKTPLASAMAAVTDLVSEDIERDPQEVRRRLAPVVDDLSHLETAITDLLDLSRVQAEDWLPHPDEYEAGEILGDVAARISPDATARLAFDVDEAPVPSVYADFAQISRALRAILDNAFSYSPAGSPVTVGASEDDGRTRLWIEDRGPGVPDYDKPLVFDSGYCGEAGRTIPSSTGLGLTIAHDLVAANGGTLIVEDVIGGGARFVIELPSQDEEGS